MNQKQIGMSKEELIVSVQKLADKWGLNDLKKQELKIFEEFGELCKAELENDIEEIKDGVGDVLITILLHEYIESGLLENEDLQQSITAIDSMSVDEIMPLNLVDTYSYWYVHYTTMKIIQKHNINPWKCLITEYEKVSQRKGETVNGTFIKQK